MLAALSNRIGFRKEVTACAVAIDEVDDFELLYEVFWNTATLLIAGLGKFEAFKKFSPAVVYTCGVLTVLLVEVFNGIHICVANVRNFIHGSF